MKSIVAASSVALAIAFGPDGHGPYETASKIYKVPVLDAGGNHQKMDVFYPSNAKTGEKFPVISYSHGMLGGALGPIEYQSIAYGALFSQLASHGYIVVAPEDCNTDGCANKINAPYTDCAGLPPVEPTGWASYYGEQLKSIEWARNQSKTDDAIFSMLDVEAGAAIAGHSMGGQATSLSAHFACTEKYNIKVAALHHSANGQTSIGNLGVNVSVPLAALGSSGDASCTAETRAIYEHSTVYPKYFRNEMGWSHLEPLSVPVIAKYNPPLGLMTAAWFKIHLSGDSGVYRDLIYGDGSDSLCKYAKMKECMVETAPSVVV
jgi:dienelactone hydrolase